MILELPLVFVDGMWYRSATDAHQDLKAITKDSANLGIEMGGRLHGRKLERCDAEGHFGIRDGAFCGSRDQMDAALDLYRVLPQMVGGQRWSRSWDTLSRGGCCSFRPFRWSIIVER